MAARRRFGAAGPNILIALTLGGALALLALHYAGHRVISPGAKPYLIAPGATLGDFAAELKKRGVLRETASFLLWARLRGGGRRMKAGEYDLSRADSIVKVLGMVTRGEVIHYSLTVIEGWRFRDIRAALANAGRLRQTLGGLSDAEVMAALGRPGVHPEGRFFPDTYRYTPAQTDAEVLRHGFARMDAELARAWAARAPGLPLRSAEEALALASIIEKETALAAERGRVAAVFTNRLRKRMRLEADPTVVYGLGDKFTGNITRAHLRADNPYNTYTRRGLPPTPIASPSAASLRAATRPDDNDALYFVARGDGSHKFSTTYRQHLRAVRKYQLKK